MPYNLAAIRELLHAAFGDEDLVVFCADHFPAVRQQFTTGQTEGQRVLTPGGERRAKRAADRAAGRHQGGQSPPVRTASRPGLVLRPQEVRRPPSLLLLFQRPSSSATATRTKPGRTA